MSGPAARRASMMVGVGMQKWGITALHVIWGGHPLTLIYSYTRNPTRCDCAKSDVSRDAFTIELK